MIRLTRREISDTADQLRSLVKETIRRHSMATAEGLWVVATSGGPDSMCLLHVLHSLQTELGITLHVAHLNHHMREQAEHDSEMVRGFAQSLGVSCTIGHADVNRLAAQKGVGVEEAGRDARYTFFRQVARDTGAVRIALGHNRNDQAETVLQRLIRGAGTEGLAGIPPVNGDVVRPLIDVPRPLIDRYCSERNIPTMTDVYNLDMAYTRNALRHSVIPDLARRFNPSLVDALAGAASVLRWDADLLAKMSGELFLDISTKQGRMTAVSRRELESTPPALSSRVLEAAWRECSSSSSNLPVGRILEILEPLPNVIPLPGGVTLEKTSLAYRFFPSPPKDLDVELPVDGEVRVPDLGASFIVRTVTGSNPDLLARAKGDDKSSDGCPPWVREPIARIDSSKVRGQLRIRTRKQGDRFKPLGMEDREQKLQDFLVEKGVPRFYRDFVPIIDGSDGIVWIVGLRIGEDFKVTGNTSRIMEIEVRPDLRSSRNYVNIWRSCPTSGRAYS